MLNSFPLTAYKTVSGPKGPKFIRIEVLLPDPQAICRFKLFGLQYVIISSQGKPKQLTFQPPEMIMDEQRQWYTTTAPQVLIKEACLPSWKSIIQRWCFGDLSLTPIATSSCLISSLPEIPSTPDGTCYGYSKVHHTQIILYYNGRFLISPRKEEVIEMKCEKGSYFKTVEELTMVTVPTKCTAITGTHMISGGPKSPINTIPDGWITQTREEIKKAEMTIKEITPNVEEDKELPSIFKPPEIVHISIPERKNTEPEDNDSPQGWDDLTDWIIKLVTGNELKIAAAVSLSFIILYCCCAPVNWPRLNFRLWCCQLTWEGIQNFTLQMGLCLRTIGRI